MDKQYVIVDIDSTIANNSHRVHYLLQDPKDWDSFYSECDKDTPHEDIIELVKALCRRYTIMFYTGRREEERKKTLQWLRTYITPMVGNGLLLMRTDGDHRHDKIVKPELLEQAGIKPEEIFLILEDRNSMVRTWRDMGVRVLQVQEGNF